MLVLGEDVGLVGVVAQVLQDGVLFYAFHFEVEVLLRAHRERRVYRAVQVRLDHVRRHLLNLPLLKLNFELLHFFVLKLGFNNPVQTLHLRGQSR